MIKFASTIRKVGLCLALASLGVVAVWGTWKLTSLDRPHVDFTDRMQVTDAPARGSGGSDGKLRFAVATMVSAEATFSTYGDLVDRIGRDVGRADAFIVRPSYAEVRKLLEQGKVDVAFVCTGTYVHSLGRKRIKLLVQPEFADGLEYRCLILVSARSNAWKWQDLRGRVMAFTDPESNTGCLVPRVLLTDHGEDPGSFFTKIVFTGSHDRSILAVARSAVDAAAVDALIWQSKLKGNPDLERKVRVVWQSETFGPPPIVIPAGLDDSLAGALRKAFLAMHSDAEGRRILSDIGIRRFIPARPGSYESARSVHERLGKGGRQNDSEPVVC